MLDMFVSVLGTDTGFAREIKIQKVEFRDLGTLAQAIGSCKEQIIRKIQSPSSDGVLGSVEGAIMEAMDQLSDTCSVASATQEESGRIVVISVKTGEECLKARKIVY